MPLRRSASVLPAAAALVCLHPAPPSRPYSALPHCRGRLSATTPLPLRPAAADPPSSCPAPPRRRDCLDSTTAAPLPRPPQLCPTAAARSVVTPLPRRRSASVLPAAVALVCLRPAPPSRPYSTLPHRRGRLSATTLLPLRPTAADPPPSCLALLRHHGPALPRRVIEAATVGVAKRAGLSASTHCEGEEQDDLWCHGWGRGGAQQWCEAVVRGGPAAA
uniref:Uncharacterized protein n=1 Tax=Arundo donax TaxID=35708 RepID=A0A0A9CRH7_ARUDO